MLVFAHRGASVDKPENTISAFEEAILQGATGIELDVFQVEDEFFVLHDRWLERTTNGQGRVVNQTKAYLLGLKAGDGLPIPTLCDVIQLVAGRCLLNIELKYIADLDQFARYLQQSITEQSTTENIADHIIISSFHYGYLDALMPQLSGIKFSVVTASYDLHFLAGLKKQGFWGVHQAIDVMDQHYAQLAHKYQLQLLVYTVDRENDWYLLKSWGVDGVFTNLPGICQTKLADAGKPS